jgi:4-aminobutyrate aminotransferase/(S)-3-amino-2-methylpropionate transaminase
VPTRLDVSGLWRRLRRGRAQLRQGRDRRGGRRRDRGADAGHGRQHHPAQGVPAGVTIGKAVGGGFPLSALATTDEISRAKPWSNQSGSSSSYGGNPLAAAAGAASLRIIEEEHLVDRSREVGAAMLRELETWVDRYPFVGCARGSGMFMALELVSDKQTKAALPRSITGRIFDECVRRGLLTMSYSPHFRIQPPLTTDEATAMNGLAILREVFDLVAREGWWKAPA